MDYRVLGTLEVTAHGASIGIGRARERTLLGVLLSRVNTPVSVHQLHEAIWGDDLPGNPDAALQTAVSRLRQSLSVADEDHGIKTVPGHYLLDLGSNTLDAVTFADMVETASGLEAERASEVLQDALDLWRGPAYAGFEYHEFAQSEIRRLGELRNAAFVARTEADLSLGRHQEIIADLQAFVTANPLDETAWSHLMLALYRSGRQADALRTFQEARRALLENLGIDPNPSLRRLEEAILRQDPSLDLERGDEPAVRQRPRARPGLPAPVGDLVGRNDELERTTASLGSSRLVSIVGPPGVGKSRLALEVAAHVQGHYSDGASWVALDGGSDPGTFEEKLVTGLGLVATKDGTRSRLFDWVRGREQLLVLDGCEPFLPAAAAVIADLLREARGLTVLVTSRQRLALQAESVVWLAPFPISPPGQGPADEDPAIAMFVGRARNLVPGFELNEHNVDDARRIVESVDGLPLGIELAAGKMTTHSLEDVADLMHDLTTEVRSVYHDVDDRHQSLNKAVAASWRLLSPESQFVFTHVALFRGTWTVDEAVELLGPEVNGHSTAGIVLDLAARSLINPSVTTGVHSRAAFTMLDVVRRYAEQRLEDSGDLAGALGRHAYAASARAQRDADQARSGDTAAAARLLDNLDDFSHGLEWLLKEDPSAAVTMVCDLSDLCAATHRVELAANLLQTTLETAMPRGVERAEVLWRLAFHRNRGTDLGVENIAFSHPARAWRNRTRKDPHNSERLARAIKEFDEAIALFSEAGEEAKAAQVTMWSSWVLAERGELELARRLVDESWPVICEDPRLAGSARLLLANVAVAESRDDEAGQILDEIEQGFDRWPPNSRIFVHDIRARLARANGRPADAFHHYRRALKEDAEPHGLPAAAILHLELGFLSVQLRDFDTAQKEFSQALALGRRLGMPRVDAMVRVGQGWLEFVRSEYAAATTYFERAHAEYERLGDREGIAHTLAARAKIEERLEDYDKSVAYALRANAMARGLGAKLITALIAEILAGEAVRSGDYLTGAHLMGARLALREACRVVWPADAQVQACDDTIRRRLGNEAEGAYAAGRKLSTEQTVSLGASLGPDR